MICATHCQKKSKIVKFVLFLSYQTDPIWDTYDSETKKIPGSEIDGEIFQISFMVSDAIVIFLEFFF